MAAERVLAQITEFAMRAPLDDPVMSGFVDAFDAISRLARASPGFVWQLTSSSRGHPRVDPEDPLRVVSVSTWTDYSSLHGFVYRSPHGRALLRRGEWFTPVVQPSTALWWTSAEDRPSADSALAHLALLRREGPTPRAFTVRHRFDASGRAEGRRRPAARPWPR
ncbi:DUF3291 domain-containing protein [Nocardioides mangrovicus]|uniref:DUF3291 domain-containing protein n=1 Tax=Nocardioides mangrovicus TaxID=2478913 RepID=A0A3L8NYS7_9ACTN|nr:DUF3291 domain-containing protein [Nocardioides mangrovicus]RLV48315.1 DUF3291 domain-containing protein [Nocardioides mangrovicus]